MALSFEAEAARVRNPDAPDVKQPKKSNNEGPPPELLKRLAGGDKNMKASDMQGAPPELHAALGDMSVAEAMKPKKAPAGEGGASEKKGDEGPAVKASELNLPDGESTVKDSNDATTPDSRKKGAGPEAEAAGGSQENEQANKDEQAADAEAKAGGDGDKEADATAEGAAAGGGPQIEDPKAKAAIPDPKSPAKGGGAAGAGGGDAGGGSVAQQFLNAAGPEKSEKAEASESLLQSAWNFASSPIGPLIGYDSTRGGFKPENLWGIGASIEGVFKAADKDRGEGALATVIKGLDIVRAGAEGVSTVAGFIGTTCGILSLIGLIPPLAPVGAALASVAAIMQSVSFWSGVVALVANLLVSVLSAIQLVQAVKEGAPNVRQLYANYQEDVGNLLANGVGVGLSHITRKFGKTHRNSPKGLGKGIKTMGATAKGMDGRVARGQLVTAIKGMGGQASLSAKGSTVQALRTQLKAQVKGAVKTEARKFAITQVDNAIIAYTKKSFTQGGEKDGGRTLEGLGRGGAQSSQFKAPGGLAKQALSGHVGQIGADSGPAKPGLPQAESSPVELDALAAKRKELAQAQGHVADERAEGEAAIEAGKELESEAAAREEDALKIDKQLKADKPKVDKFEKDAESGKQEAKKGKDESTKLGGETDTLKGDAEAKKDEAASTKMPDKPKPKGLWGKIKAFFQEKVFGLARKALDKVRQFITDMILEIVATCMGVDDIDAELAKLETEMTDSKTAAQETKGTSDAVGQDAGDIHKQAADADAAAKDAQQQGQESVDKADDLDAQIKAKDEELKAEEEAIKAKNDAFEGQEGPGLEHRAAAALVVNPEQLSRSKQAAQALGAGLDAVEKEAAGQVEKAKKVLLSDAAVMKFSPDVVKNGAFGQIDADHALFVGALDKQRGELAQLEAEVAGQAGKPFTEAEVVLNRVSSEIAKIAAEADAGLDAFLQSLTYAVQATGKALEDAAWKERRKEGALPSPVKPAATPGGGAAGGGAGGGSGI